MNRRGLTLFELLIVIALIGSVVALILPVMTSGLGDRAFAATGERIRGHLLLARAEAMTRRIPLEVRYTPGESSSRIDVTPFTAGRELIEEFGISAGPNSQNGDVLALDFDEGAAQSGYGQERSIFEPLVISGDLRLVRHLPIELAEGAADSETGIHEDFSEDALLYDDHLFDSEPQSFRLAVFLADGTAIVADPIWLTDDEDRFARLSINPWTGIAAFERHRARNGTADITDDESSEEDDQTTSTPARGRGGDGQRMGGVP